MAIAFRSASAKAAGTGAVTPALPASMVANDIVILVATTIAGGSISITANGSIGTWNALTGSPIDVTGGEKLYVWWGRWSSGSTGPTVTPGSDHCCAGTVAYSGCSTGSGLINAVVTGTETTSDTSFSFATATSTTVNNCLCVCVCSSGQDSNSSQIGAMANSSLTSLANEQDFCTNSGGGGGYGLNDGQLATAGSMGTWTATLANATPKAYIAFALQPQVTTTKTQLGKARIQATTTKTQLGKGNIRATTTNTQLGKARIQATTTKTQLGKSRIQTSSTKTQSGKSRIQATTTTDSTLYPRVPIYSTSNSGDSFGDASTTKYLAKSFIARSSYTLDSVIASFHRVGSPAFSVSFRVYTDSAGAPGAAIGSDSNSVAASTFPNSGFGNSTFSGLNASLTAGTKYWIVGQASSIGNGSNCLAWRFTDAGASNEKYVRSSDASTWTIANNTSTLYFAPLGLGFAGISRIQATSSQTQPGRARVQATTTKTQAGKSRVQNTSSQTIQGKASIQSAGATTTQTQQGIARIQATATQTQLGKSRVQVTTQQTQPAKARIQTTSTKTQTGTSRIQATVSATQTGTARIQKSVAKTQAGKARVTGRTTQTQLGKANVQATTTRTILGKAKISDGSTQTTTQTISGKARIVASVPIEIPAGGGYWKRQRKREEERRKKKRKAILQSTLEPIGFSAQSRVYFKVRKASFSECLQPIRLESRVRVRCRSRLASSVPEVSLHARGRRHWKDRTDRLLLLAMAALD